ncbi:unnamed protein product [Calypogeia fissa]
MASCCWAERLTSQSLASSTRISSNGSSTSGRKLSSSVSHSNGVESLRFAPLKAVKSVKSKRAGVCRAGLASDLGQAARVAATGLAAFGLSALLELSPVIPASPAIANELTILTFGPNKEGYVVDDANVLNRVTKSELKSILGDLEANEGYHIDLVTLRKLTIKSDAFEFADQVLEKWYPTIEEGNKKGIVLLVTTQKEGAVTGGPAFIEAVGEPVLDGVATENLPVLATDEKYNEAFSSTAKRLINAIKGLPDVPGPKFQEVKRESNFKSKQETEEKRGQFTLVVGGLLVIAFVVPMAQYYAYVSKK